MGYFQDADKFAVVRAALALVNPSTLESFSYVVMEAWLVGTPVLVRRHLLVTAGDVIRSGGGLVYHDHEDFNRCILELMCDQTRQQMGRLLSVCRQPLSLG